MKLQTLVRLLRVSPLGFFLLIAPSLIALPNNDPKGPELPEFGLLSKWDARVTWKMSYSFDRVFSKRLEIKDDQACFRYYLSKKHLGSMILSISDRVELDTTFGLMDVEVGLKLASLERRGFFCGKTCFLWSVGGRALLMEWGLWVLGVSASYARSTSGSKQESEKKDQVGGSFLYREWQVGMSVSREMGFFSPYVGLSYSSFDGSLYPTCLASKSEKELSIKTREPFIPVLGASFALEKGAFACVEGRFFGEKALTFLGTFRF